MQRVDCTIITFGSRFASRDSKQASFCRVTCLGFVLVSGFMLKSQATWGRPSERWMLPGRPCRDLSKGRNTRETAQLMLKGEHAACAAEWIITGRLVGHVIPVSSPYPKDFKCILADSFYSSINRTVKALGLSVTKYWQFKSKYISRSPLQCLWSLCSTEFIALRTM